MTYEKLRDAAADAYMERETQGRVVMGTFIPDTSTDAMKERAAGHFKAGFDAATAHWLEQVRVLTSTLRFSLDGLKMWRKFQSPGNISEVEQEIHEALRKWAELTEGVK